MAMSGCTYEQALSSYCSDLLSLISLLSAVFLQWKWGWIFFLRITLSLFHCLLCHFSLLLPCPSLPVSLLLNRLQNLALFALHIFSHLYVNIGCGWFYLFFWCVCFLEDVCHCLQIPTPTHLWCLQINFISFRVYFLSCVLPEHSSHHLAFWTVSNFYLPCRVYHAFFHLFYERWDSTGINAY